MKDFYMNGIRWTVVYVPATSAELVDRLDTVTVATTDPRTNTVYICEDLRGDFLIRVLLHELGHCALVSFGLLDVIHAAVYPDKWIEAEEWVCNFLADHGRMIFDTASQVLGYDAIKIVPRGLERIIA